MVIKVLKTLITNLLKVICCQTNYMYMIYLYKFKNSNLPLYTYLPTHKLKVSE